MTTWSVFQNKVTYYYVKLLLWNGLTSTDDFASSGPDNSCNIGTRGLPDIHTLSPRACGPRALGVYIRQTTCAHVTGQFVGLTKEQH